MLLAALQPATLLVTSSGSYQPMNWRIACRQFGRIDERDAARRLVVYGRNALAHAERPGLARRIWTRLTEPLVAILAVTAAPRSASRQTVDPISEVDDVSRTAKKNMQLRQIGVQGCRASARARSALPIYHLCRRRWSRFDL